MVRLLWWAVHGASAVLLLAAVGGDGRPVVAVAGVLLAALYAAGPVFGSGLSRTGERVWLVTLTCAWAGLATLSAPFAWLVFPLFFAFLYVLPLWAATFAVTVLACAAGAAASWHAGGVSAPLLAGPAAGAVLATLMWAGPVTGSRSRSRARDRPARPPGA
ncbi:hypothetical protein [Nonomuraea sp. NPDC003214]